MRSLLCRYAISAQWLSSADPPARPLHCAVLAMVINGGTLCIRKSRAVQSVSHSRQPVGAEVTLGRWWIYSLCCTKPLAAASCCARAVVGSHSIHENTSDYLVLSNSRPRLEAVINLLLYPLKSLAPPPVDKAVGGHSGPGENALEVCRGGVDDLVRELEVLQGPISMPTPCHSLATRTRRGLMSFRCEHARSVTRVSVLCHLR